MSSQLRYYATQPNLAVKFHRLESPCYDDDDLGYVTLFPFTYSNGVLDIEYIDSFEADMVDISGNAPSTGPDVSVKLLGGTGLVQSLGENFKTYIRAWRNPDVGTPINVYINGVMQRAQMTTENFLGDDSWEISTTPPSSDDYVIGAGANNFRTTWIFKKPLTITTVEGGITRYITFTTRIDED
jgi:hypothetical protein